MSTRAVVVTEDERHVLLEVLGAERDKAENAKLLTRPESPQESVFQSYLERLQIIRAKFL